MRGVRPDEMTCPRCGFYPVVPSRMRRRRAQVLALMASMTQREMAAKLGVSQACIRKDIAWLRGRGVPVTAHKPGPRPGARSARAMVP
jgi:transposase